MKPSITFPNCSVTLREDGSAVVQYLGGRLWIPKSTAQACSLATGDYENLSFACDFYDVERRDGKRAVCVRLLAV